MRVTFEAARRRPSAILSTVLMLLGGLVTAPFIRPFRFSRLFWTHLIPRVAGLEGIAAAAGDH